MMRAGMTSVRAWIADGRSGAGRHRGFTLIELMVCVGIISLLVTILGPTLSVAVELARRARCAANLNGIGRALSLYDTHHRSYPYVRTGGAGWGVPIGSSRQVEPNGRPTARSPSSCLYLLVRERYCAAGIFVCPSAKEQAVREAGDYWDFADGRRVSYAVMNPYGPHRRFDSAAGPDVAILADSSGYFDPATGLRNATAVVDLSQADDDAARAGNSPNHRQDGQNVMLVGGSTEWVDRADVGCNLDNIYTRAAAPGGTDRKGAVPAPGPDAGADDQGPAGPRDSYLVQ